MTRSEPVSNPSIELDLTGNQPHQDDGPRRSRPIIREAQPSLPKIEPILGETDVGSDETERTVGILFVLSAFPGALSFLSGHGTGALLSIAVPLYFGIGLLRRDEFIKQWVFAACFIQLIIGVLTALIFPTSILMVAGGLAQNGGLLVLVSGRALSRRMYLLSLAAVTVGTLAGATAVFLR
ncbi:MAG: hypothetical protein IPQ13_04165 [Holophagaceae bacterium]|nr:hypothetical protein [Holophagaceae bacterium]